jgi:hypothetical protein
VKVPARLLAAAGVALHGERWQSALADDLEINLRTAQRWAAAARDDKTYEVSRNLLGAICGLLEKKFRPLERAYEGLKAFHDGDA